jgi:hypothetical protein
MESLVAVAILGAAVAGVSTAVTTGQQQAYEANQRLAGALAAEEFLSRTVLVDYAFLHLLNGYTEPVGAMIDEQMQPLPAMYRGVGRQISVRTIDESIPSLNVVVRGREVRVRAFDAYNVTLAEVSRFVPEPPS